MLKRKIEIVELYIPRRVTSFSLPIDLLAELRDIAVETGVPLSRIV